MLFILFVIKVAIPYWQGRISPVFDAARELAIFEFEPGSRGLRQDMDLTCEDFGFRAAQLSQAGVNVLICGAISRPLELAVSAMGIEVISQICGTVNEVFAAFKEGRLLQGGFLMPGCGGRQYRFRGRRGGRGGRWSGQY